MATIAGILRMSVEERKTAYKATGIDKVIIDGNEFTDYGAFSFLWEKSYVKSPERSGDGTIGNLNSYATFITPHLEIDFSMMSIDSYRRLMELIYEKNEFLVECYDVVYNTVTQNKMYFSTEEMPKLWTIARAINGEEWVELLGVQDYTVELIGTNVSLETVNVLYYDKDGVLIPEATQEVYVGTEVIIGYDYVPTSPYRFDGAWTTELNGTRRNGEAIKVSTKDIKLYAQVSNENQYTLSFNYGKGIEPIQSVNAQPVTSVNIQGAVFDTSGNIVTQGETIATSIANANIQTTDGTFAFPENGTGLSQVTYEFDEEEITVDGDQVYEFSGWYWTSEENTATKVTGATAYNYATNRTIYQIYKAIPHTLTYDTGTTEITLEPQSLGYGETVLLPRLARNGYNFKGWFLESGNGAPTTMPPKDMKVLAKWEKI